MTTLLTIVAVAALAAAPPVLPERSPDAVIDTDGDGLSDFQERHKYHTDPRSADSDADGIPDGDWDERREYAYTVRAVVQVLPPVTPDVCGDDYQDARILDVTDRYVELEVIYYPLNTVATAIAADPDWRRTVRPLAVWTEPGLTANWDPAMRDELVRQLAADGIDAGSLDDETLVRKASRWLLDHATYEDGFTTFCTRFVEGVPEVHPALRDSGRDEDTGERIDVEAAWDRELFARGMFANGVRGSCTSSAIYLDGCLRALGIPTRIVLTIPVIDASDERELALVGNIRHHGVRAAIEEGTSGLGRSWASHTFNEVFVGGRWRRLNYDRLGQNTLDPQFFGLLTHVATFSDWADGNMAATWGVRQRQPPPDDPFGGSNPYSTIALSDRFGAHASIDNPPAPGTYQQLTIDRVQWFGEHPAGVDMRLDDPETAGHLVVHVVEGAPGEGPRQYKRFYDRVGKTFRLEAPGHGTIPVRATRGYWAAPEKGLQHFYLRIEPADFAGMAPGVEYALVAVDASRADADAPRWVVADGVTIRLEADAATERDRAIAATPAGPPAASPAVAPAPAADAAVLTLDQAAWSDGPDSPTGPIPELGPVILVRMGPRGSFDEQKQFTEQADRRFFLEAPGVPTLKVGAMTGGITSGDASYLVVQLGPGDWRDLRPGVEYELRPRNASASHHWRIDHPIRLRRE
ncbi:MAG: transglutaminase domain-containing protein [Phycisphaerales bacterium]|nr:transglutaminase domain-containing protein [Phycisphaerales bacterium]